jgi:hypothetical protein
MEEIRVRSGVLCCLIALAACASTRADLINLVASRDNTLYYDPNGQLSNGAGVFLFSGLTGSHGPRRTLLSFDVASAIPAGSTINSVQLRLQVTRAVAVPRVMGLYPVLAAWGEGTSNAGTPGGAGTGAAPNDATWSHRFYGTSQTWATPGGDYSPTAVSTQTVNDLGSYTWPTSAGFASLAQSWLTTPASNFGIILVGDEVLPGAKRFASREYPTVSQRPTLIIDYTPVPAPAAVMPLLLGLLAWRRRRS